MAEQKSIQFFWKDFCSAINFSLEDGDSIQ